MDSASKRQGSLKKVATGRTLPHRIRKREMKFNGYILGKEISRTVNSHGAY